MSLTKDLASLAALRRKAAAYEGAPLVHRTGGRRAALNFGQLTEDEQLKLAQEGSTVLYAALRIIAVAASSPPWVAERRVGDGWEALPSDHPASAIVETPNGFDDWRSLMERLVFTLIPTGNHLWYKAPGIAVGRGRGELPAVSALWPLLPLYQAELGDDDYPIKYTPRLGLGRRGTGREYEPADVIHFQRTNGRQLGWGAGVVAAAARVLASDIATAEWQQESYDNRLVPDGAFVSPAVMTPDQRAAAKEALKDKQGPEGAHDFLMLEGGWKWEPSAWTPVEADYINTRAAILEEICAAVNLRPALLVPQAKYANLKESRDSLWLDNVLPMLTGLASKVTRHLGPHFGRSGETRWRPDTSKIEALRTLLLERVTSFAQLLGVGTPYNHALELTGLPLPPLEPEIGDVPHGTHVAVTIHRVRADLGLGAERLASARPLLVVKAERKAFPLRAPATKAEARERATGLFAAARSLERRLAAAYRRIGATLRDPDSDRRDRILRALLGGDGGAAVRAAGAGILRAGLGLPADDVAGLGEGFTPLVALVRAGADDGVALGAAALSEATGRDLTVAAGIGSAWAAPWAVERAEQIAGSTERGLAETVAEWRTLPGWGEEMAAAVVGLYATLAATNAEQATAVRKLLPALIETRGIEEAVRRAQRLAEKAAAARGILIGEQQATAAIFGGQQQAAADLFGRGVIRSGRRRWVDSDDDRVCPECAGLDGEEAELDEPYVSLLSGASYMAPGEPHNHCRCGEIYFEIEVSEAA